MRKNTLAQKFKMFNGERYLIHKTVALLGLRRVVTSIFRLDALALSVIATATWLGGWLTGWLSHSGIVSKRLNLSENFFDPLKAQSL